MGTKLEKPTAVSEDPRYYTLDGMRGVAALMVVHFHYVLVAGYVLGDQHKMQAYLAVDLFFALSGFVIALSYSDKLASALSISGFVKRRLIRLYPLYIFGIALGLSIEVARALSTGSGFKISEWAVEFGFNLFFLPSFQHEILFPLNLPAWSLFYEMAVNILFAWVLWRVPAKLLVPIAIASIFPIVWFSSYPVYFGNGDASNDIVVGFARTLLSFIIGILLFRYARAERRNVSLLACLPLFFLVVVLIQGRNQPVVEFASVLLAFPLLLFFAIRIEPPAYLRGLFSWLGDISYPVYLIHFPLMIPATTGFVALGIPPLFYPALFIVIVAVLGYALGKFYDEPVRRFLRSRDPTRRTSGNQEAKYE